MIGAKVDCRYFRSRVNLACGRWAWRLGRSRAVRSCGLTSIADPGSSSSVVGWESRPSKGQGFPGNASSSRSQPVLSITPKELCESGNRLIFRCLETSCTQVRIRLSFLPDQVSKVVALFNRSRLGECRNDENLFEARIAGLWPVHLIPGDSET